MERRITKKQKKMRIHEKAREKAPKGQRKREKEMAMRRLEKEMRFKTYRVLVRMHHLTRPDASCHVILLQNHACLDVLLDRSAV